MRKTDNIPYDEESSRRNEREKRSTGGVGQEGSVRWCGQGRPPQEDVLVKMSESNGRNVPGHKQRDLGGARTAKEALETGKRVSVGKRTSGDWGTYMWPKLGHKVWRVPCSPLTFKKQLTPPILGTKFHKRFGENLGKKPLGNPARLDVYHRNLG